jgi:hypothetical protein
VTSRSETYTIYTMITIEPGSAPYLTIRRSEIPEIIAAFRSCIDEPVIRRGLERRHESNKSTLSLMNTAFLQEFILYGLDWALSLPERTVPENIHHHVPALFFMKLYSEVHSRSGQIERNRIDGMLRDVVIKSDPRVFFYELLAGFHFIDEGYTVAFMDLAGKQGNSTYEYFLEKDGYEIELEVKTITDLSGLEMKGFRAINSFCKNMQTMFDRLRFAPNDNELDVLMSAPPGKGAGKATEDLANCVRKLERGDVHAQFGCIRVARRAAPTDAIRYLREVRKDPFKVKPPSLSRFPIAGLSDHHQAVYTLSFQQPWRIANTIDNALKDAFSKFSKSNPALVFLYLVDAFSFSHDAAVQANAVWQQPAVRKKLDEYRSPGRYGYPTGLLLSGAAFPQSVDADTFILATRPLFGRSLGLATKFNPRSALVRSGL